MLSHFPRDVLDKIWDLIGSVSEGFLPTVSNPKLKRLLLKNKLGAEPGEAPQNRSLPSESCVKSTFNNSRICIMSS